MIFSLIRKLAEYERAPDAVTGNEELLADALFAQPPAAEALLAEVDDQAAGFALFYPTFSTWECNAGIWLEDLYVEPQFRRQGVGEALLAEVARITRARGGVRLEWAALDWNSPALRFYEKLGASLLTEWRMHRIEGDALEALTERGD